MNRDRPGFVFPVRAPERGGGHPLRVRPTEDLEALQRRLRKSGADAESSARSREMAEESAAD
jgi:hypothetical protein